MAETTPRGIQATLFDYFKDSEYFDIQEANDLLLEKESRDINRESIRARIYEGIDKGLFERVGKGLYTVTRKDEQGRENTCLLINGDGRDLSIFPDNSVDAIITDHPYDTRKSLKGGNRNFADYDLFQYNEKDFQDKIRILKPGRFLVEFLPEENGDNYQYLYRVKELARAAGFEYYAKVPWKKGDNFVANTGRKSKNTEDICFFTKGRARSLRPDAKKNKADPDVEHFMSGAAGMLPTVFDIAPPKSKIHQAEKPIALLEQILRFVTKEDELVLDQFAGSGVLGEAALNTHRNSVLIEKDLDAYNKLRERIAALGEIETVSASQCEVLNIAVDALEAVHDGPDAIRSFSQDCKKSGRALADAFVGLSDFMYTSSGSEQNAQQEALEAAAKAIEEVACYEDIQLAVTEEEKKKVLECSSKGDRRFSALYAMVTIRGRERSIEEWYQDAKRTSAGKRAGKGKSFDYIVDPFTGDKLPRKDAGDLYRGLWITYFSKNPDLVKYAEQFDDFTNAYSGPGLENSQEEVIGAYVKGDRDGYIAFVRAGHWYKNMVHHKSSLSAKIAEAAQLSGKASAKEAKQVVRASVEKGDCR